MLKYNLLLNASFLLLYNFDLQISLLNDMVRDEVGLLVYRTLWVLNMVKLKVPVSVKTFKNYELFLPLPYLSVLDILVYLWAFLV